MAEETNLIDNTIPQDNTIAPPVVIPTLLDDEQSQIQTMSPDDWYFLNVSSPTEKPELLKTDEEKEVKKEIKPEKIKTEFRLLTKEEEEKFYPVADDIGKQQRKEKSKYWSNVYSDSPEKIYDNKKLKDWTETEFFKNNGQEIKNELGIESFSVYRENDQEYKDLKEKYKANFIGGFDNNFSNLDGGDLDKMLDEVFDGVVRKEMLDGAKEDEYRAFNNASQNGESAKDQIERLKNGRINANKDKKEGRLAQLNLQLDALGDDISSESLVKRFDLDSEREGLIDAMYKVDEYSTSVDEFGNQIKTKTGNRIFKNRDFQLFHNLQTGENIDAAKAGLVRKQAPKQIVDISDKYQAYLSTYKNTSRGDLARYNDQHLLREAGYNLEGEEEYKVNISDKGNVTLANRLRKAGYSPEDGVWNIKLKDIEKYGAGSFTPNDISKEELIDLTKFRRLEGMEIKAEDAALWETYYLNKDVKAIEKTGLGIALQAASETLIGPKLTSDYFAPSGQKILDTTREVFDKANIQAAPDQEKVFERSFGDKVWEAGGGLLGLTPYLVGLNKGQAILGINKAIGKLTLGNYAVKGRTFSQSQMTAKAVAKGIPLAKYADDIGAVLVPASNWQKGKAMVALAVLEDVKMKEGLGTLTGGRLEFERWVGAGFAAGGRLLPYSFKGYTKNNPLNTALDLTLKGGPAFAVAVEMGEALNGVYDKVSGREEWSTFMKKHWGDRDEKMQEIALNLITGAGLGATHLKKNDLKKYKDISKFKYESLELATKDQIAIEQKAKEAGVIPEEYIAKNPLDKAVQDLKRHTEDYVVAEQYLDQANKIDQYTDPVKAEKIHREHLNPIVEAYKNKGKTLDVEISDKPVYQKYTNSKGKDDFQQVNALFTPAKSGQNAKIEIDITQAKGKGVIAHEALHAYFDLAFEGNIALKKGFENSFRGALQSIKVEGSNLYDLIKEDKGIAKELKFEEMFGYTTEYLSKVEHYDAAVGGGAFKSLKQYFYNLVETKLPGQKPDITTQQDILDFMGRYADRFGKLDGGIKQLERFGEIIKSAGQQNYYDVNTMEIKNTNEASKPRASKDLKANTDLIENQKAELIKENKDLRIARPNNYKELIAENVEKISVLNQTIEGTAKAIKNDFYGDKVITKENAERSRINKEAVDAIAEAKKAEKESGVNPSLRRAEKILLENNRGLLDLFIEDAYTPTMGSNVTKNDVRRDVYSTEFTLNLNSYFKAKRDGKPSSYEQGVPFGAYLKNNLFGKNVNLNKPTGRPQRQGNVFRRIQANQTLDMAQSSQSIERMMESGFDIPSEPLPTTKYDTYPTQAGIKGINVGRKIGVEQATVEKAQKDVVNLDFTKKSGREVVSFKNITPNARKTIGEDIVVGKFGVAKEMYNKSDFWTTRQLNDQDFKNIKKEIQKPGRTETWIEAIPEVKQIKLDRVTGEIISPDFITGKSAGIAKSLLKLPLLFKETVNPGTKPNTYEHSARLKEYYKTNDLSVKEQFIKDVQAEVFGIGEGVSQINLSQKQKAALDILLRNVYVQSVETVLPEIPGRAMIDMVNQITAGKGRGLASKKLGDKVLKYIDKNVKKDSDFMLNASPDMFVDMFKDKSFNKISKKEKDNLLLQANKIDWASIKQVKTVEQQAELMFEGMAGKSKKEVEAVEAKNFKQLAESLKKQGGYFKDIVTNEGLESWTENMYSVAAQNKFDLAIANKYSPEILAYQKTAFMSTFGQGKVKDFNPYTSKYERRNLPENNQTTEGFFKTHMRGELKFDANVSMPFLKDVNILSDMGGAKTRVAELTLKNPTRKELIEASKQIIAGKKDFNSVVEANQQLREFHLTAMRDVLVNHKNYNLTKVEAAQAFLRHLRQQTNISNGLVKGTATVTSVSEIPGIPVAEAKGQKNYLGTMFHAEHLLQLLNHTGTFATIVNKTKGNNVKFQKQLKELSGQFEQAFTVKQDQLVYDSAKYGGNTTYAKLFKGKNIGEVSSILNVMYRPGVSSEIINLKTGKTWTETILENYNKKQIDFLLKENAKKGGEKNAFTINLEAKNKTQEALINSNLKNNPLIKKSAASKKLTNEQIIKKSKMVDKAIRLGRKKIKEARGMSTFDFDETLREKGKEFVTATKDNKSITISSEKFPIDGPKLAEQGYKFDFKDFVNVKGGVEGPLMQKLKNQIAKYGNKNVFVLTARMQEAAPAIHAWLKSKGVELPIENITGLGNSTGEAKALWMLEKFSQGYNDMYFVDDALPNVKAVKDVLGQLDIKSSVQIARASKNLETGINDMMEYSLDIASQKRFSKAEGKIRGKDIKRRRVFLTDSAADLELLIEPLYGKGKKGIENKQWFKKEFITPYETGIRDYNTAKQSAKNDYMALRKQNKEVVKKISKPVEATAFTNDMAMRVYLWNKAGYKIPDLAKTSEAKLVDHVKNNPDLQAYADSFSKITKQEKGLKEPGENWWAETMAGEVAGIDRGVSRKQYLQEFIDVKNEIFSEVNLNKMESKLGTRWRENIEDMFDRMETGRTRSLTMDRGSAMMMNYLNGSIGSIMNFNTRSAALQTISTMNFLNMRENNPIAAARAMGNVKQFAKDFKYIMNSDMLKQRRDGLEINVTEAEIASAAAGSKNPIQSIIAKVLKVGYLPTKLADSFAISFGGATYYRNRIKMYEKQGMETKAAEKQAFLDFQVLSERTQQSSRADLLSKQQTSLIGRFVLPFANTPMQMNRAGMKEILDISKGRYKGVGELSEKMGRVTYYMGAQVALFAGLQSGLFAMMMNDDDVKDEKIQDTKIYSLSSVSDSFLRGFGVQGAILSGLKNATIQYAKQSKKPGFTSDYTEVGEALLNISPPIGSKFSKLDKAGDMMKWAKIKKNTEFKFELGNPSLEASLLTIEALTNAPLHRYYTKSDNINHALSDDYETWQRAHMLGGWSPYSVGIERERKKSKRKTKYKSIFDYGGKTTKRKKGNSDYDYN